MSCLEVAAVDILKESLGGPCSGLTPDIIYKYKGLSEALRRK